MRYCRLVICVFIVLGLALGSAWAQVAVTDPATTAQNAIIAVLKNQIVEAVRVQHERLLSMARRLSAQTNLNKYGVSAPPPWRAYDDADMAAYGDAYRAALSHGDPTGRAYTAIARTRQDPREILAELSPATRAIVERELATLDAADSTIIAGTRDAGALRFNGSRELNAIDALESDVIDPSNDQSATAVLDKISGAALIETRQKQARLQYLTAIVEQLLVDNKRARDTEASLLNMQLHRMRGSEGDESGGGMLTGAADDLRTWRQP